MGSYKSVMVDLWDIRFTFGLYMYRVRFRLACSGQRGRTVPVL